MRILLVAPHFYPHLGGIERHVARLGETFVAGGHDVTVATVTHTSDLPKLETVQGMRVLRFRTIGRGTYNFPLPMLAYLLRHRRDFDVVHAFNYGALPLLFASLIYGKRCVVTPCYHRQGHTSFASALRNVYDPFAKAALRNVAAIVCLSKGEAQEVSANLSTPLEQLTVVPSGIAVPKASSIAHRPSSSSSHTILSVSRLEAYKRVDKAIEAVSLLDSSYRLTVVGDGPDRERLIAFAESVGAADRVRFMGTVSDEVLRSLYQQASVVVTYSENESFGITVLEALHYGKRVVCSDIPAFRDFNDQFPQAVSLVQANTSAQDVAHLLREAANSHPLSPLDLQVYTWPSIASNLLNIYEGVNLTADKPGASFRTPHSALRTEKAGRP